MTATRTTYIGLAVFVGLAFMAIGLFVGKLVSSRTAERTLAELQAKNPTEIIRPVHGSRVDFGEELDTCRVEYLLLTPAREGGFNVTVGMQGIHKEPAAAMVGVSFYDQNGKRIGTDSVVRFTRRELNLDEWRDVTDVVRTPTGVQPAYAGIYPL